MTNVSGFNLHMKIEIVNIPNETQPYCTIIKPGTHRLVCLVTNIAFVQEVGMCVYVCVCMLVYVCVCMCVYVCVYACACVHV